MIKELLPQALGHTIARACTVMWSLSDSLEHEKILYLEKTDEQILYLEKTNVIDSQVFESSITFCQGSPVEAVSRLLQAFFHFLKSDEALITIPKASF